ncbi:hypothetical protein TcYC6_0063500 [Trypanosoma cruzi]|nr:hypothetical protein TcYC6_0063500 [Trypanosoma cruzi]
MRRIRRLVVALRQDVHVCLGEAGQEDKRRCRAPRWLSRVAVARKASAKAAPTTHETARYQRFVYPKKLKMSTEHGGDRLHIDQPIDAKLAMRWYRHGVNTVASPEHGEQ